VTQWPLLRLKRVSVRFLGEVVMRLSEELEVALSEWERTPEGFEMKTTKGLAKLYKKGKREWFVSVDGKEKSLGKRASFDHAEGYLVSIGAKPK